MGSRFFHFKRLLIAACIPFACAKAVENSAFNAGGEWGWGGETSTEQAESPKNETAPAKKPIEIPYFDQDIGQHLLAKDFRYLANADIIRESFARSINVYRTQSGRFSYFGYTNPDFYEKVFEYLASESWEQDLKTLSPGDAAFVRIIAYYCFTGIENRRYIQTQLEKIEDGNQSKFLEEFFRVKRQHESLRSNHWNIFMGLGANFFSNGAENKLGPGPSFDFGFNFCLTGMFCSEFRIGSIVIAEPYKEDIEQSGVIYPKEFINYTAVEALLSAKLIYTFDYDVSVFAGLRLHAIEFDSKEGERFRGAGRKDMANGYSYGYTMGISGAKYFAGNGVMPKLFGISVRAGVANFGDNILDIGGYNWYGGIDLVMRLMKQ